MEEAFGWMNSVGGLRRPMLRGLPRLGVAFTFVAPAYNIILLPMLLASTAPRREGVGQPRRGRWRIIKADLWNRDHLDLCSPARMIVQANGHGDIAFRAKQVASASIMAPTRSASPG